MQCDELSSFVDDRGKQQWVCLALDAETPEVVGVYVSTQIVGIPTPVYRQGAIRAPRVMPPAYRLH